MRSASNHPGLAIPKGPSRKTLKRRRRTVKTANIRGVRERVMERDGMCRLIAALREFGLNPFVIMRPELAHLEARGMGGNPTLTRDTTANTFLLTGFLHTGDRSHHSGHLKIRPLTDKGMDGPVCFELYEKLPTEL